MSKTLSFNRSHIFFGLIGSLIIWLSITIAYLIQTMMQLNRVQQLNTLPLSPQQQAIQQALEKIDQQTVKIKQPTE